MRTIILGALLATAVSGVSAQEIMAFDDPFVSQKTRAEVIAEMAQADARGLMKTQGEITWIPSVTEDSERSRAIVREEARFAASAHERNTLYDPRYQN